jgi:penicillin amidase
VRKTTADIGGPSGQEASVRLNRVLSYLNYAIGLALLAALGAAYWYLYRPQAQSSGTVAGPVARTVEIRRDPLGVPHISAQTLDDLFFAQGYVHAQDRLFQMDLNRRQAAGELAEVFGAGSLNNDVAARRLQMRKIAERNAALLSGDEKLALVAYSRGVNHFIETHRGKYPIEFAAIGYDPSPWVPADSMVVALGMSRLLSESWQRDLAKQALLESGDPELLADLYPLSGGVNLGSNSWAVAGRFTKSRKPILANDPHLPLSLPGIWYENHLRGAGINVAGVSIPGLPAVVIGRNDNIAWGITNLEFDAQDLYVERVDSSGVGLVRGMPERVRQSTDVIRVRGAGFATLTLRATSHGPLVEAGGPVELAVRWNASEPNGRFPLLALNRAANWDQFRSALSQWTTPAQNFVYADAAGNIGYQAAGLLPKRANFPGDLPVDGTSGKFEWDGYIPFEDLPTEFNPALGHIVSANQSTFPPNYPYPVNGKFAAPDRARQIEARLAGRNGLRTADMLAIQTDHYSAFLHFLAKQSANAAKGRSGRASVTEAAAILEKWDGQMDARSSGAMVAALVWKHLEKAIVERASPGKPELYNSPLATVAAERLLRERPAKWFPSFDEVLVRALLDALAEGTKEQGDTIASWQLGPHQQLSLANPVLASVRYLRGTWGGWIRLGPAPMSGSPTSVNQYTGTVGPSLRMVIDFGDPEASVLNLVSGQSGQVLSGHYRDQWDAYLNGTSFPLRFGKLDSGDRLTVTPLQ